MTVETLTSRDIPPIRTDATIAEVLPQFATHHVQHLPLVDFEGCYLGVLSEDILRNVFDPDVLVDSFRREAPVSVGAGTHPLEAVRLMQRHHLTLLPVTREGGTFDGVIAQKDLFEYFSDQLSAEASGSILVIECAARDYSVSQLAYLFEQHEARILSIFTHTPAGTDSRCLITIKTDVTDTARIRYLLAHHGYTLTAYFCEETTEEDLQDRVDEFLHYLAL